MSWQLLDDCHVIWHRGLCLLLGSILIILLILWPIRSTFLLSSNSFMVFCQVLELLSFVFCADEHMLACLSNVVNNYTCFAIACWHFHSEHVWIAFSSKLHWACCCIHIIRMVGIGKRPMSWLLVSHHQAYIIIISSSSSSTGIVIIIISNSIVVLGIQILCK